MDFTIKLIYIYTYIYDKQLTKRKVEPSLTLFLLLLPGDMETFKVFACSCYIFVQDKSKLYLFPYTCTIKQMGFDETWVSPAIAAGTVETPVEIRLNFTY